MIKEENNVFHVNWIHLWIIYHLWEETIQMPTDDSEMTKSIHALWYLAHVFDM